MFDLLLLLLAGIALVGGLIARTRNPTTRFSFYAALLAAVLSFFPSGLGFIGWQTGLQEMEEALRDANEVYRPAMRAQGEAVIKIPFQLGTKSTLVFLLPSLVLIGLNRKKPTGNPSNSA